MKRAAVTGASGFVGKNLIKFLDKKKYEIHCIVRTNGVSGAVNHQADLFNYAEISRLMEEIKPDICIHLAWNVENQSYWHSIENHAWAEASIFLAEQFLKYGGNYMIFAGTSASYDYKREVLIEDSKMEYPDSLYGISKWYASQVIQQMCERAGAEFLEARIFSVFGDYERNGRLVSNTIRLLMDGKQISNHKWGLERDYIYIKDAVKAIVYLMENEMSGVFNISKGRAVTLKWMLENIAEQLGKTDLLLFEDFRIEDDVPCIVGSNEKLIKTGFDYSYTMEEAVAETIQWYKNERI